MSDIKHCYVSLVSDKSLQCWIMALTSVESSLSCSCQMERVSLASASSSVWSSSYFCDRKFRISCLFLFSSVEIYTIPSCSAVLNFTQNNLNFSWIIYSKKKKNTIKSNLRRWDVLSGKLLSRLQNIFCLFLDQSSDSQCRSRNKEVKITFALLFFLFSGQIWGQSCDSVGPWTNV